MSAQENTASFIPKRSIGPFTATVTVEENGIDELEITQHPVQQGANIADHAYIKPSSLDLKVAWSGADAPLSETYDKLLKLQLSREPFTVVTGKRTYKNMLIKSIGVTTDAQSENILSVSLSLQEVFLTAVEVVAVSASRSNQKHAAKTGATSNAGRKQPEKDAASSAAPIKRSALAALAGNGG